MDKNSFLKELNKDFAKIFLEYHKDTFLDDLRCLSDVGEKPLKHHLELASKYELGYDKDIVQSYRLALLNYIEASRLGDGAASLKVGLFYFKGLGCNEPDFKQAEKYFRLALNQGNPAAVRYINLVVCKDRLYLSKGKTYFPVQRKY